MSNPHKDWLIREQTALGKDKSNPFMAYNLPKIVWYSTHHIFISEELASPQGYGLWLRQWKSMIGNQLTKDNSNNLSKSWLVQKQTASGKDKSNPLTADDLLKIIWLSVYHSSYLNWNIWLLQK